MKECFSINWNTQTLRNDGREEKQLKVRDNGNGRGLKEIDNDR